MLRTSLLFLHAADEDKNYNEELESNRTFTLEPADLSTIVAICSLISILGLIGNGIVLWLLRYTTKDTKFTVYVGNLAVADFIIMLRAFISFLGYFSPYFMNIRMKQLMIVLYFFGQETNIYFLAAVSTERCLTVFSRVWYQSHRRKCSTAVICALLWTLSVTMSIFNHFLCTYKYILALKIGTFPCRVATIFDNMMTYAIIYPSMAFPTLALFIRMKIKPQPNLPARLDISILSIIVLQFIFYPATDIIDWTFFNFSFRYPIELYYLTLIFYCLSSCVNPFIYLLVGSWKKGQKPFCMFLDRALKDKRKEKMRTQPDLEQA